MALQRVFDAAKARAYCDERTLAVVQLNSGGLVEKNK
jgi:hypothetical protein